VKKKSPKLLFLDIETAPLQAFVWGTWDQNVALNQIKKDWHVLSWAAKWQGSNEMLYMDQSKAKDITNDKNILKGIWKLIDEADIIVTQNGKSFDIKKLNARFVINGFKPPSSFKHIDTLRLAKKYFGFTSNKLEYLSNKLNLKYKKLKHNEFSGFELWLECLLGNPKAWKTMEKYNKFDVLALEELYNKLVAWDGNAVNFSLYHDKGTVCSCGSTQFRKNGFFYSATGKYQRYYCVKCGAEARDRKRIP
jgi:uncharacterized protein YprB with RNaseH-like and TPR domain